MHQYMTRVYPSLGLSNSGFSGVILHTKLAHCQKHVPKETVIFAHIFARYFFFI